MSRTLSASNTTEIDASHLYEVVLVKMAFDTPVYAHSSTGTITYDSNDYLGVGDFGTISEARESEQLGPSALTFTLSGVDASLIVEGLDSGNYGDIITVYKGYRQDDNTLVDDPWIVWRGWYENADISKGDQNVIRITAQHDLSMLDEKDGTRFTDEQQQSVYAGDNFFEFVHEMQNVELQWGARPVTRGYSPPHEQEFPVQTSK